MNIKKTVKALLIINGLQFIAAILLWLVIGTHVLGRVNPAVYLTIGILLLSSLLTLLGLYAASRFQDDSYRESMKNLENLNLKLRAQRHDYLNHLQVIYGLLQLLRHLLVKRRHALRIQWYHTVSLQLAFSSPSQHAPHKRSGTVLF